MAIVADDLSVGQYVTVEQWYPMDVPNIGSFVFGRESFGSESEETVTTQDQSYCGDVLRIEAVNLPYVVVENLSAVPSSHRSLRLDTRRLDLMPLSDEYVEAAVS